MDPWYRVATPRKEVREGRSLGPSWQQVGPAQAIDSAIEDCISGAV
jgi:hypothetical protein